MADDFKIPRYDTREQIEAVRFQEPKPSYFRSSFFSSETYSPTERIEWDEVREGSGMARYVGENLEVEATEREGYITKEIETPKIQEKRVLGVNELKKRLPGENVYSAQTPAQRAQYYLDGDYAFCMDSIDRRVEQQCAQMMVQGRVDIIGKGVNTYVDYELPFRLTLAGTDRWDQPGVSPFDDLEKMAFTLMERGYVPTEVVMERSVANIFLDNDELKKQLDNRRLELGLIAPGAHTDPWAQAQFFGTFARPGLGVMDFYTYDGRYKDDTGAIVPYLDEGRVLMLTAEAKQNRIMYGAYTFMDENEKIQTVEGRYTPEIFVDRRARTQTIMVTSRPMPAPFKSDSWYTVKVK